MAGTTIDPEGLPWETWDDPELAARSPLRWRLIFSGRRTPTEAMTVGLAEFFPEGGSRVGPRGDRPYETSVEAPEEGVQPAHQGFRLVLEGRLTGYEDGRAVRCRSAGVDQRPVCLFAVDVEQVSIRNPAPDADPAVLAEWRD